MKYETMRAKVSGDTVVILATVNAVISGNDVNISGETVYFVNNGVNNVVQISGQTIQIAGSLSSNVSGQTVYLVNDGFNNVVAISGQTVQIAGGVNTSGQTVYLVNNGINNVVKVSGQAVSQVLHTVIRTRATLVPSALSGGTALQSGDCDAVVVRNIGVSGTVMYLGSTTDPPWVASGQTYPMASGFGFWLRDGDGITIQTNNMANVRVVTHVSGQYVSYMATQY